MNTLQKIITGIAIISQAANALDMDDIISWKQETERKVGRYVREEIVPAVKEKTEDCKDYIENYNTRYSSLDSYIDSLQTKIRSDSIRCRRSSKGVQDNSLQKYISPFCRFSTDGNKANSG